MGQLNFAVTENDKKWLKANFPALDFGSKGEDLCLRGTLKFDMIFCEEHDEHVINPGLEHQICGQRIKDQYEIEIIFAKGKHSNLPQVYEIGNRIPRKKNRHIYDSGNCCLCMPMEEEKYFNGNFTLKEFFYNLVIPFLYSQSYYKQYHKWPWGDYSHGICGILEWYSSKKNLSKQEEIAFVDYLKESGNWAYFQKVINTKVRMDAPCCCGERKRKYASCHPNVLQILWKLHTNPGTRRMLDS